MFYVSASIPNPKFNLFGVSRQKQKAMKTYDFILQRSKAVLTPEQMFDRKNSQFIHEHFELETLFKEEAEQNAEPKKKELKYVGQTKAMLRSYRSQAVLQNLRSANQRMLKKLNVNFDDPALPKDMKPQQTESNKNVTTFSLQLKKARKQQKSIDVGMFFQKQDTNINDPVLMVLRPPKISQTANSKLNSPRNGAHFSTPSLFQTFQGQNLNHQISSQKFLATQRRDSNASKIQLPYLSTVKTKEDGFDTLSPNSKQQQPKPRLSLFSNQRRNSSNILSPINSNFKQESPRFSVRPNIEIKQLRESSPKIHIADLDSHSIESTPRMTLNQILEKQLEQSNESTSVKSKQSNTLFINNLEQATNQLQINGASSTSLNQKIIGPDGTPRSLALMKYDKYKKAQMTQHHLEVKTKESTFAQMKKSSIKALGNNSTTVLLINQVVDEIQMESEALEGATPSNNPGTNRSNKPTGPNAGALAGQLDEDFSQAYKNTDSILQLSLQRKKLTKKFKPGTIKKYQAKIFDFEKNEMDALARNSARR